MMISPIKHLTAANEGIQIGLAAAQSVSDVIDTPAEIDGCEKQLARSNGEITFKNVNLRYDNAKNPL